MGLYDNLKRANSSYVPQFVGSEAAELKSVGDVLDNRYRQNQNSLDDALITVANEDYAPGDEHIGQNIYSKLAETRDQIASSDANFENSTNSIRSAVKQHVLTNPARIQALRNSAKYKQYQELKQKLGPDAVDFTPEWQGTVGKDGTLNTFNPQVEKRLDYDQKKETFFNQFEANLMQSPYAKDAKNPAFLKSIISGGISDKRIDAYKKEALNRYKQSSEYNQEFRAAKRDHPELSNQQIDDVIERSILSTGLERVHGIQKEDLHTIPEYAADGAGTGPEIAPGVEEFAGKEYKIPAINPKALKPLQAYTYDPLTGTRHAVALEDNESGRKRRYEQLSQQEKDAFNKIVFTYNPNAQPDSKEGFDIVNNYYNTVGNKEVHEVPHIITAGYNRENEAGRSRREDATKDLVANWQSRHWYNPLTGESIQGNDPKFLKKINDATGQEFKTIKDFENSIEVRGEFSPKNSFEETGKNPNLVDPYAVKVGGATLAVTRPINHYSTTNHKENQIVSKVHQALNKLPGIANTVNLQGYNFLVANVELEDKSKGILLQPSDKNIEPIIVNNLEDIPKELRNHGLLK